MDDLWQRLLQHWRKGGLAIESGVDQACIEAFEHAHGIVLPDDLRDYFRSANGTGAEMDRDFFRFWPLEELQPVETVFPGIPNVPQGSRFFVIADFCISCWIYAVRIDEGANHAGPVVQFTSADETGIVKANSFREFVESYLADPNALI